MANSIDNGNDMFGIGIDIIEISRIEKAVKNPNFISRNFTSSEIAEFDKLRFPKERIAAYFAMKEAIVKSIGTGFGKLSMIDIEILKDESGRPYLHVFGKLEELLDELGVSQIMISCSHCKEYAVANAYASRK